MRRALLIGAVLSLFACSADNTLPQLQPVADQIAYVGNRLEFVIFAYDADGEGLTFSYSAAEGELGARPNSPAWRIGRSSPGPRRRRMSVCIKSTSTSPTAPTSIRKR